MPAFESSSSPFTDPYDNRVLLAYFDALQARHSKIRMLGLPSMAKLKEGQREIPIDRLFVRPSLLPNNWREGGRDRALPLEDAIRENFRLVVLGDPGSGKSTAIDWLTTAFASGARHRAVKEFGALVPFPLVVRDLELPSGKFGWEALLDAFLKRPMAAALAGDRKLLGKLLESGQAYLLLDGVDEIARQDGRRHLREAVHEGWRKYPSCRWLITSRIVGYDDVEFHSSGDWTEERKRLEEGNFPPSHVIDVKDEFITANPSARVLYLAPFDDGQVEQFSRNWFRRYESDSSLADEKSRDFIRDIRLAPEVMELSRTPNLLTLMALIYLAEADLPNGRAMLYQKIAQAYLETIDRFRKLGFDQSFDYKDRVKCLSKIAFEMQNKRSATANESDASREILVSREFLKSELGKVITTSDSARVIDEFIGYLGRRTGLLIPRGIGEGDEEQYAFAHLSFQEYFAACYLESGIVHDPDWADEKTDPKSELSLQELRAMTRDPAWMEVFYLFFEIVSDSDRSEKWAPRLIKKELFPEDSSTEAAMPLLSRILADPQCKIDRTVRRDQIARCWRHELERHQKLSGSTDGEFNTFRPEITVNLTGETSAFGKMAGDVWQESAGRSAHPDLATLIDAAIALCDRSRSRPSSLGDDSLTSRLVAIIEQKSLPAAGRALAGNLLGSLGDPRPGVTWKPPEKNPRAGFVTVPLAGVEFSIYPVTNDQFQPFVEAGGYGERGYWTEAGWEWKEKENIEGPEDSGGKFPGPNHPRIGVSWYEAVAYCRWLSKELGREVRLPTDGEWVAAVNPTGDREFPWGNEEGDLVERANYAPDWNAILGSTSPVGVYPKGMTPEGLFDIAGNVWEWSLSKWEDESDIEKNNIEGNESRVLRGGAWGSDRAVLACSARIDYDPYGRLRNLGFRVVFAPSF